MVVSSAAVGAELARPPEAPADLAARIAALRSRWQQAPTLMARETLAALNARYAAALASLVQAFPESFRGTDLDPDANRRRAEELCARVEKALPAEAEPSANEETPASVLAARLREALAANTIGGGVAVAEAEARSKAAAATVKDAQALWPTLGPMPDDLQARFDAACRRVLQRLKK